MQSLKMKKKEKQYSAHNNGQFAHGAIMSNEVNFKKNKDKQ